LLGLLRDTHPHRVAGWRSGRRGTLIPRRKVRTPKGRVLANSKAGQPDGKWNRKHTADGGLRAAQVRLKWCGKSAPASWRQGGLQNPTRSKAK